MSGAARGPAAPVAAMVAVDKPVGPTSHDVVAKVRRALGTRRVGHAGTLDPAASGVLVLGIGRATRLLGVIAAGSKSYLTTIRLGVATTTDDAAGSVMETKDASCVTEAVVLTALEDFRGEIRQRPSSVSAVKIGGQRAHARVRAGEDVVLPERTVTVSHLEVVDFRPAAAGGFAGPELDLYLTCSSGTYVRALARDLGRNLGVGGHVRALRRTSVGDLTVEQCTPLASFLADPQVTPVADMAGHWIATVSVTASQAVDLSHGRTLPLTGIARTGPALAVDPDAQAVAYGEPIGDVWQPTVVLTEARDGPGDRRREETGA